jgi:BirA family transcriptional regulator, biotin operon repressor / biotin---[acetyl-CoA-carboxylase] ligase
VNGSGPSQAEAGTFGHPHRHYRVTDSTNERARDLAEAGAPGGSVVTAVEQRAGRGRHGRRWSAPAGAALLYSAILAPLERRHALLPLAVPLAVCEAVESLAPVACTVKWPNDIWLQGRKLAGVLIEARPPAWAVIGIGLNLQVADDEFPADLRWPATSVGHGVRPGQALDAVNESLGTWVPAPPARILGEFRARDALAGREVRWEGAGDAGSGSGIAAGVDERGNLLVATESGERVALGAGEVSLRIALR